MSSMAIDRRHFLIGTSLTFAAASASRAFAGMLEDGAETGVDAGDLIAACRRPDGTYSVVVLTLDGAVLRELPLEGRGHDIALDRASGQAVVFARRPGSFALAFDIQDRREPVLFTTPANRHFYGHGVFSRDGRLLYATEHDNETRAGLIGIYDATGGYKRIGEVPTYGIGPHEVILLADGKTLAVANGGIETHVESGSRGARSSTSIPCSLRSPSSTAPTGGSSASTCRAPACTSCRSATWRRMRAAPFGSAASGKAPTPRRPSSSAAPASTSRCASSSRQSRWALRWRATSARWR